MSPHSKSAANGVVLPGPNIHNWIEFGIPIRAMVFTSKNGHVRDEIIDQVDLGLPRDRIGRRVGKNGVLAANSKQWMQAGPFEGTSLASLRVLHTSAAHNRCKVRTCLYLCISHLFYCCIYISNLYMWWFEMYIQ
jgi:hypothetical protein